MDFKVTNESSAPFDKAKGYVWLGAAKACEKTNFGRLLGVPVFIATQAIEIPQRVAIAGETVFKGAANMAAAPWNPEKASFFRGVKQIFSLIPQAIQILASPLRVAVYSVITPALVVFGGARRARKEAAYYGVESFRKAKEKPQDSDSRASQNKPSESSFSNQNTDLDGID